MKNSSKLFIPENFLFSAVNSGIKPEKEFDLGLIYGPGPLISWGVFTQNTLKAWPVVLGEKHIKSPKTRAVIANSGIANAASGKKGLEAHLKVIEGLANKFGIKEREILPASTGVIGPPLPHEKILSSMDKLIHSLSPERVMDFAKAIMTTDTFPKVFSIEISSKVRILGIAKGAGMIAPNMATMLAFILTDGEVRKSYLKRKLKKWTQETFNAISVDGDTSTNDTVYFLSSNLKPIPDFDEFEEAVLEVMKNLAQMIVKDGEGATKVIKILVSGAKSRKEAENLARAVGESLLVKTAFYGADPNWGRILAALGKTGISLPWEKIEISLNGKLWLKGFEERASEEEIREEMKKEEVFLEIKVGKGKGRYLFTTCDLTEKYVEINSSYRT